MISLAKLSIRRPKTALCGWLLVAIALITIGFGVSRTMSPSITVVKGTESARAEKLADAAFGPSQLVPILLEGPKAQLDRVGPRLVIALNKRPHTRLLSAWDAGTAGAGLRPSPTAAMIVVSVDRTEKNVVNHDQPQIERLVRRVVGSAPITAYITGQPSIDRALRDAAITDLRRHELIAAAIVFFVLLIGLRAPVAALLVTVKAAASMLAASLARFQLHIAQDRTVASVVGPGSINETSNQLKTFGPSLIHSAKVSGQSKKDLVKLIDGLGQAGAGSARLQSGLEQAVSGANQLHGGSGQAAAGGAALHNGLAQAKSGSEQLEGGLNQALSGAQRLETGAAQALSGSGQLLRGISLAQGPASQSLPALNALSRTAGSTSSQIAGALALVLTLALRAIVLPVAAVILNLLVVAAAFGVVQMLFGGSNPPLGGPGYLDPITVISIFSVAFGISVSYSTVVLMRTREAYERRGNPRNAARAGLNHTAAAATGAAIAMVAAMIPFATTELINVRELCVGVGVAVLLSAFVLRPTLLPAAEVLLGRIGWWPTHGPRAPKEPPPEMPMRRPARTRRPHGRPRPRRPIRREVLGGGR
jgi:X-X-X-Leu-X-X-Gly heptad repeat protein